MNILYCLVGDITMNTTMRKTINDISDIIRNALNIEGPIIDIDAIVRSLNGELREVDSLEEGAEGRIFKNGERFIIEIPKIVNENRRTFTIAHELGHLFLHMGYLIDQEMWNENSEISFFRKDIGEMEYQAHEFAASFLMPREEFFREIKTNYNGDGSYNIEAVAEFFNVSIEAATNRGKWLGIIAWT